MFLNIYVIQCGDNDKAKLYQMDYYNRCDE